MTDPLPKPLAAPQALPDEMTVAEVARRMGYHTNTIYKMVEDDILPHDRARPKARIRFSRDRMAIRFPNTQWYD